MTEESTEMERWWQTFSLSHTHTFNSLRVDSDLRRLWWNQSKAFWVKWAFSDSLSQLDWKNINSCDYDPRRTSYIQEFSHKYPHEHSKWSDSTSALIKSLTTYTLYQPERYNLNKTHCHSDTPILPLIDTRRGEGSLWIEKRKNTGSEAESVSTCLESEAHTADTANEKYRGQRDQKRVRQREWTKRKERKVKMKPIHRKKQTPAHKFFHAPVLL